MIGHPGTTTCILPIDAEVGHKIAIAVLKEGIFTVVLSERRSFELGDEAVAFIHGTSSCLAGSAGGQITRMAMRRITLCWKLLVWAFKIPSALNAKSQAFSTELVDPDEIYWSTWEDLLREVERHVVRRHDPEEDHFNNQYSDRVSHICNLGTETVIALRLQLPACDDKQK